MAKQLETAIRKLPPRKTSFQKSKPKTWPHHLRLLRAVDGVLETDISLVMKWYCAHIGEEFVPLACSGESFRKKFPNLLRACSKDKISAVTEITQEARDVAERLYMLGWPKGSRVQVLGAVQASLTAYYAWRKRLHALHLR